MRLRAALGLSRADFNDLSMGELTQFAFATGEEIVIGLSHQSDAVFKAVEAAFSEEPARVSEAFWNELMARVHYPTVLTDEDYIAHNNRLAEQFTGRKFE